MRQYFQFLLIYHALCESFMQCAVYGVCLTYIYMVNTYGHDTIIDRIMWDTAGAKSF